MALPKLNTPLYELELPSTGEKIKYRPFLVKEQKNLMIALESEEAADMKLALSEIITSCTFAKVDPYKLPMFDVEYLFLKFRGKSIGEKLKMLVTCPDDNETQVEVDINLEEVNVQLQADHTNIINLTDNIKMIMKYPDLNDFGDSEMNDDVEGIFKMIAKCIAQIHDGDTIHEKIDISEDELNDFVENMTTSAFEKVQTFFETMPKVRHVIKVKNPKTKKTGEVVIEGLENFFE